MLVHRLITVFGKTFSNVWYCVSEVLFVGCASYVSVLCRVDDSLYRLNGSLWVERLTRCEWGGLAVTLLVLLAVSRVTGYFGRAYAVGV